MILSNFYVRVFGDFACFTNPLMNIERVSYPFMTPSAARGILESILYKPEFRYQVNGIAIKNEIKYVNIRRNEIKNKISRNYSPLNISEERTQRMTMALKNVSYVISVSIVNTSNFPKYSEMFVRRLQNGQCFHQPFFGCKEFITYFEPATEDDFVSNNKKFKNYGTMVFDNFDLDTSEVLLTTFNAQMVNGIVMFPTWEEVKSNYDRLVKEYV